MFHFEHQETLQQLVLIMAIRTRCTVTCYSSAYRCWRERTYRGAL